MKKILLVGLIASLILSGCASASGDDSTADNNIILTVLVGQSSVDAGVEDMLNDFIAEKYPQVTLNWETVAWGNEFDQMLRADFAASEVPDIIIGKAQNVAAYYKTGHLAEIGDSLASFVKPDSLADVRVDNKIYGIPYNENYQGVIYNKAIFRRLGLTPPTTTAELQHIVDVCSSNNVTPFAYCCQDDYSVISNTMQFMLNEIFKNDDDWGTKFRMGLTFIDTCKEVVPCFENNKYMLDHSWTDASQIEKYACDTRFATGKAAMYMTSTWVLSSIKQNSDNQNFGIFPYPNVAGNANLIRESNMTFMKSSSTKYSSLVDQILTSIMQSKELSGEISEATQTLSVIQGNTDVYPKALQEDIDNYVENRRIIDSIQGYNQLSWNYLSQVTAKEIDWMKGYTSLNKVLYFAELKRPDSSNMR